MAQDHGLCREKKRSNGPVHGPPLQARVAAANGTVLQLANCWPYQTAGPKRRSWRTWYDRWQTKHNEQEQELDGGKQNERGKNLMKGSGHGRQRLSGKQNSPQNRHCRQTQPVDSPPGLEFQPPGRLCIVSPVLE